MTGSPNCWSTSRYLPDLIPASTSYLLSLSVFLTPQLTSSWPVQNRLLDSHLPLCQFPPRHPHPSPHYSGPKTQLYCGASISVLSRPTLNPPASLRSRTSKETPHPSVSYNPHGGQPKPAILLLRGYSCPCPMRPWLCLSSVSLTVAFHSLTIKQTSSHGLLPFCPEALLTTRRPHPRCWTFKPLEL